MRKYLKTGLQRGGVLFSIWLLALTLHAQTEEPVFLIADAKPEGIYLRWGYDDAATMRAARANGITLTRREVGGGTSTLLEAAEPAPFLAWAAQSDTSEFAGAIANLLYQVPDAGDSEMNRLQDEQAAGMILFAADHDFAAAENAALGFFDDDVSQQSAYEYTLSINGGKPEFRASLLLKASHRTLRFAPKNPRGNWIRQPDDLIGLSWLREATDTMYTSYFVERASADAEDWQRLNDAPLIQILNEANYDSLQFYNDTTARLDTDYRYRLYGMTPFGTYGPRSEPLLVPGRYRPLVGAPYIMVMTKVVDTLYRVQWQAGPGLEIDAVSYRVSSSDNAFEGYRYQTEALPPDAREAMLVNPKDAEYIRVEVTDRRGITAYSQPKLIRVFDEVPPAPPTGLSGSIDSTGKVTLNWTANTEEDHSGYRVFVANQPTGYFPQLTAEEWFETTYFDKITMDTRAEKVYYKIKAIDYTGNYSDFSEVLMLERPDFKPPSPPVIREFRGSTEGVGLETAFSSSDDVVYHLLQRFEAGDWNTLDTIRSQEKSAWLNDTSAVKGRVYDYRVVAVDDVELKSFSEVIAAGRTDNKIRAAISDFDALIPAGMKYFAVLWKYPAGQNLRGFQLYRADAAGELAAYKFLTASSPELEFRNGKFMFFDVSAGKGQYTYQMMAVHHDGGHSPLTQAISVTRPE